MRSPSHVSQSTAPASVRPWMLGALLVILIVVAYLGALPGDFLWDDDLHVTANPTIIGPQGLREIWTTAAANYFPLVLTNFWVQHALWGVQPLGYHLMTLACHAFAAVVLWRVLTQLRVRGAWLGAALWALHPVQVESVAWICELKNTQSAVFFLLAIGYYLKWLESHGSAGASASHSSYPLALIFAVCAILSKPSTVTLPVALALCVWWQRRRLTVKDFLPLLPFFVLSLLAAGWTIWEQRVHSGAEGTAWAQTWPERFVIAGRVVWFYVGKLAWPEPLIFIYPRWEIVATWLTFLPFVAVLAVVAALWWNRRGPLRPVFFAAVYFGALLFPVLGFFSIYFFRYSFVGDHFQYLASIGPLALAGAGLTVALGRLPAGLARLRWVVPALLLIGLSGKTWRESTEYLSHESLWRATLAQNPKASMAWFNLGDNLVKQGRHQEAIDSFRRGVDLRPDDAPGYNDLACELVVVGRPQEALGVFARALTLRPGYAEVHNNLGNALRSLGRIDEAIAHYEQALQFKPDYAEAHNNLGCELSAKGRAVDAIAHLNEAVRLEPTNATNHNNLANALRNDGRAAEAFLSYERALKLKPNFAEAQDNYGLALAAAGRDTEALARFEEAVRLNPESAKMHRDFGTALARAGRSADAIAQFEAVVGLDPGAAAAHALLGNALAQAERWPEAAQQFQAGLRLAPDDADLHSNLAVAWASTGKLPEAVTEFQHALRLRPGFIEAHTNLAQILRSLGRNLEAADHYDEAERLRAQLPRRL